MTRPRNPWPARVKALRTRLGLTQKTMAPRVGLSYGTMAAWECGSRKPGKMAQLRLAELEQEAD